MTRNGREQSQVVVPVPPVAGSTRTFHAMAQELPVQTRTPFPLLFVGIREQVLALANTGPAPNDSARSSRRWSGLAVPAVRGRENVRKGNTNGCRRNKISRPPTSLVRQRQFVAVTGHLEPHHQQRHSLSRRGEDQSQKGPAWELVPRSQADSLWAPFILHESAFDRARPLTCSIGSVTPLMLAVSAPQFANATADSPTIVNWRELDSIHDSVAKVTDPRLGQSVRSGGQSASQSVSSFFS